jgi:hypothetical protein
MPYVEFVRIVRTSSSERFLLQVQKEDAGVVDLHFNSGGTVAGTVVLLQDGAIADEDIPDLLTRIDEVLLPDVAIDKNNLFFTVVRGAVVGSFRPD